MYDILMIEDEKELAGLLQIYIERAGYTIQCVTSGEAALTCLKENKIKMVLLDITLPGIDGFTVCKEVRKTGSVPILIISARIGKEDKLNGFRFRIVLCDFSWEERNKHLFTNGGLKK